LDAARYADSDGYEKDKPRVMWFYRDWVVDAFNRDLPYDQFIIQQIAGDLLPDADRNEAGSVIDMVVEAHDEPFALTVLRSDAGKWRLPRVAAVPGTRLRVRVRARDVMIATQVPKGISALNVFAGTITAIDPSTGADAIVTVQCGTDRILARATRRSVSDLRLTPGTAVHLLVKSVTFDSEDAAPAMPAATGADDEIKGLRGRRR
jgi:molybdate transport system ATP-binding protein